MNNNFLITLKLMESLNDNDLFSYINAIDWQEPVFEHIRFMGNDKRYDRNNAKLEPVSPIEILFTYGSDRLKKTFIDIDALNKKNKNLPSNAHDLSHKDYYDVLPLVLSNLDLGGFKKILNYIEEENLNSHLKSNIYGINFLPFLSHVGRLNKKDVHRKEKMEECILFILDKFIENNKSLFKQNKKHTKTNQNNKIKYDIPYQEILSSFLVKAINTKDKNLQEICFKYGAEWSEEAFYMALIKGQTSLFDKHPLPLNDKLINLRFTVDWNHGLNSTMDRLYIKEQEKEKMTYKILKDYRLSSMFCKNAKDKQINKNNLVETINFIFKNKDKELLKSIYNLWFQEQNQNDLFSLIYLTPELSDKIYKKVKLSEDEIIYMFNAWKKDIKELFYNQSHNYKKNDISTINDNFKNWYIERFLNKDKKSLKKEFDQFVNVYFLRLTKIYIDGFNKHFGNPNPNQLEKHIKKNTLVKFYIDNWLKIEKDIYKETNVKLKNKWISYFNKNCSNINMRKYLQIIMAEKLQKNINNELKIKNTDLKANNKQKRKI